MRKKILVQISLFIIALSSITAQENDPWIVGIGINIVDNSGTQFDELLNVEDNWNLSKLVKISLEKRFEYDYGIELAITLNEFTVGKIINNVKNAEDVNYIAFDLMVKNYTTNYFTDPRHSKYQGYVTGGIGANFFGGVINTTIDIGFGLNFKISEYILLNLQTLGKFSIDNNTLGNANHLQHSISTIIWL